ncbi:deoxyribose-phosphate aldolase [Lacticaseibacillus zhaodongensis]|uniref:deoxyribose-phosphate aldolase n=1 Tax=Lacticaseibacillus zhaodongensis TaxID=2668065 RepID=UPI0012D2C132|nr:deoxyribose-phosphate aldolase [Lacticaseibacillus zhaodongensis]
MSKSLAKYIDHTQLQPDATRMDIIKLLVEAQQYDFASVCVNPYWVSLAAEELRNSDVNVCTVIGFPLGATTTAAKVAEANAALADGAVELDMVINIGALRSGDYPVVQRDIAAVAAAVHAQGALLKVIIEAALLTDEEKVTACQLSEAGEADFVKTSTGFAKGGATVHDVALMKKTVGNRLQVKAAGGIHSYRDAEELIAAGADRLGVSAGVKIMEESGFKLHKAK